MPSARHRSVLVCPLAAALVLVVACAPSGRNARPESVAPPPRAPIAVVGGVTVPRSMLLQRLSEAAGARVLEEIALDRAIETELRSRALEPSEEDLSLERTRLLDLLSGGLDLDEDTAAEIETEIRRGRGLGPERWAALLERSAGLRLLVRDRVDIGETAVRLAFQQRHGERRVIRLIQVDSQREAARYREEALASPEPASAVARLATDRSTDAGARGTLLTISVMDPRIPEAIRRAADGLTPQTLSPVVASDDGYALVWLEDVIEPDPVELEDVRPEIERLIRLRQERLLMESEARALLASVSVTVFDASLAWAWETREAGPAR